MFVLVNFPPEFDEGTLEVIRARESTTVEITVKARDRYDPGPIDFRVIILDENGNKKAMNLSSIPISGNRYEASFSFVMPSTKTYLEVWASDADNVSSIHIFQLVVCLCKHQSVCIYDQVQVGIIDVLENNE